MDNIPFRLRRNLFSDPSSRIGINPSALQFPSQQEDIQPQGRDYGLSDIYGQIANAEAGPAQKNYRDFLSNEMPIRDKFAPSKMARISAVLSGIGEGIQHGPGAGYKATQQVMDSGYNDAVDDFRLKGDRLAKAADLEEKDINNRVKTYRDIVQDENARRDDERKGRLTDAQIANYDSLMKDRTAQQGTRGWNFFSDQTPGGHRYGVRMGPNGMEKIDAGTASPSLGNIGDIETVKSNARFPNESKLAHIKAEETRTTQAAKFKNIKELLDFKKSQPNNEIRTLDNGDIVLVDKNNNNIQYTGFNSGKLGDKEKADLGLITAQKKEDIKKNTSTISTTETKGGKTTKTTQKVSNSVRVKLSDGREKLIPRDQLEEAKKRDKGLVVLEDK